MTQAIQWQNRSVLAFAKGDDPIQKMEDKAQAVVLEAVDNGWPGPPFDPLKLASLRGIKVRANASVPDARISKVQNDLVIEYNPNRSPGRMNFSIAHEIAHTFFEDWSEKTRHRLKKNPEEKNWQLEMLCNIGAAEILMPVGSISERFEKPAPIEELMSLRSKFQVSTEAMLIRMAKVAKFSILTFAASRVRNENRTSYRIDYSIPSSSWSYGKIDGLIVQDSDSFSECVAIGTTSRAIEKWSKELPQLRVEAVGLPPYPGTSEIRIAGFVSPDDGRNELSSRLEYRHGDATAVSTPQRCAIVHLVNDKARSWGGFGFARALRRRYPEANATYRSWASLNKDHLKLGNLHSYGIDDNQHIVSLVAQSGYGPSSKPRIRYSALHSAFEKLCKFCIEKEIRSVQMPRLGAGQAGGNWPIIEGIVFESLVLKGIDVKVYELPPS